MTHVIPGLVPGIQLSASAGAGGMMDPGDKRRYDRTHYPPAQAVERHLARLRRAGRGPRRVGSGLGSRNHLGNFMRRLGRAEQIALHLVASLGANDVELLGSLDP